MPDWSTLISAHHAATQPDSDCGLVIQQSATEDRLKDLYSTLGIEFPKEFTELYMFCDGFGVKGEKEPLTDTWWFFRPIDSIERFASDIRSWFKDTHPEYASRFFPFIDFANGDGIGYIADENGNILDGLCSFEHELYGFEAEQDVNEFLSLVPITIEGFLASFAADDVG